MFSFSFLFTPFLIQLISRASASTNPSIVLDLLYRRSPVGIDLLFQLPFDLRFGGDAVAFDVDIVGVASRPRRRFVRSVDFAVAIRAVDGDDLASVVKGKLQ